jgi:hypothetical protein
MLFICIFPFWLFRLCVANFFEMANLCLKKNVTYAEGMHVDRFHCSYVVSQIL